jgi:hypothetical protein
MSDPRCRYKIGETVDAMDSRSVWEIGVIEQMTREEVVISWPQWQGYKPEAIRNWESRIMPLGSHLNAPSTSDKYKRFMENRKTVSSREPDLKVHETAEKLFKVAGFDICPSKIWPCAVKEGGEMKLKDDFGQEWIYRGFEGKAYMTPVACKVSTSLAGLISVTKRGGEVVSIFIPFADTYTANFEQPKAMTYFASVTTTDIRRKLRSTDETRNDLWADFIRQGSVDYTIHINSSKSSETKLALESDATVNSDTIHPLDGSDTVRVHSAVLCSQSDVILAQFKNSLKADEKTTREWIKTNPFMTTGAARLFCRMLYCQPEPENGGTFHERMAANILWTEMGLRRPNPFFSDPDIGRKILNEDVIIEASSYAMKINVADFTEAVNKWMGAKENTEKLRKAIEKHSASLAK